MALRSTIIRPNHGGWQTIKPDDVNREQLLNRHGLSKGHILTRLRSKLDATKAMALKDDLVYVEDNPTQIKAVELGLKLHGMIDKHDDGPRVGTINIMWAGGVPPWAQSPLPVPPERDQSLTAMATISNDNQLVKAEECIPISTIEGTESAPAATTPTRPAKNLKSKSGTLSSMVSKGKQK